MFSRKKKTAPTKERTRSKPPGDFGFGIPGFDQNPQEDDADLEAELLALTGGRKAKVTDMDFTTGDEDEDLEAELARLVGGSSTRNKGRITTGPGSSLQEVKNTLELLGSDEEQEDDVDENDPELLSELQMLTIADEQDLGAEQGENEETEAEEREECEEISQLDLIKSRLNMYKTAEAKAKSSNESSRARRFNRGTKTLEKLLKRAQAGEVVPYDEIPPEIATNLKPVPHIATPQPENPSSDSNAEAACSDMNNYPGPSSVSSQNGEVDTTFGQDTEDPHVSEDKGTEEEREECEELSQLDIIKSRLNMYRTAEAKAKSSNESSRARRFNRGTKTLEMLLKRAQAGEIVPNDEIPPEIATNLKPVPDIATPQPEIPSSDSNAEASSDVTNNYPGPSSVSSQNVEENPHGTSDEPAEESTQPEYSEPRQLSLLKSRRDEYKKIALTAKKSGDLTSAMESVRLVKMCDKLISLCEAGNMIDESQIPPAPEARKAPPPQPQKAVEPTQKSSVIDRGPHLMGEIFTIPKTVLEALNQRLNYYTKAMRKAESMGLRSDARKLGDIVRVYQNAIRLHQRGSSVPYEKLPTPPGCPPIPLAFKI